MARRYPFGMRVGFSELYGWLLLDEVMLIADTKVLPWNLHLPDVVPPISQPIESPILDAGRGRGAGDNFFAGHYSLVITGILLAQWLSTPRVRLGVNFACLEHTSH
jgi:hypothetical protein